MTTTAQWIEGARPKTLPAALSPVLVGTGAAIADGGARPVRALLALLVALSLQVGVNYANDYSDGIRGTDAERVGPLRLTGSGTTAPKLVLRAALIAFGVAAVAGLVLALQTSLLLLLVGVLALAAAWGYTGGKNPYGYRGLGEVSVFVFFGLVAVMGTTYVQREDLTQLALAGGIASGALACAILVTNNLRDIPTDTETGKQTLAVRLGAARTRDLYSGLLVMPFAVAVLVAVTYPGSLLALLAVPLAVPPLQQVRSGAVGRDLVAVLQATGKLQLAYGLLLGLGLALS
ncbi:MAG: 1,4-dihydroxy-2-naphthoate polyprenyltransferase [Pseudorhodobacter sp.]|nr:1,4-dihydroxy-2-naphthoate polyprenyltransferase [Frankiaceae bacterium]